LLLRRRLLLQRLLMPRALLLLASAGLAGYTIMQRG
jgi:hypothetical protein